MTRSELQSRLAEMAAFVFDQPSTRFTDDTKASDIPRWDSLNHVKLLVTIEDDLGLRFGNADLEDPQNWGQFVDMIMAKMSVRSTAS